jgi:hypothetical protein
VSALWRAIAIDCPERERAFRRTDPGRQDLNKSLDAPLATTIEARMEDEMGRINWARVFLGGLLAGVIINIFEFFTNDVFLTAEWEAVMKALGRTNFPSPGAVVIFLIWGFLSGIAAIWLYAAVRPRFGPGVKTAILSGFAFWLLTTVLRTVDDAGVGYPFLYPPRLLVILVAVCFVQFVVASAAGAWVYKE